MIDCGQWRAMHDGSGSIHGNLDNLISVTDGVEMA
jgi:hypothetical protein